MMMISLSSTDSWGASESPLIEVGGTVQEIISSMKWLSKWRKENSALNQCWQIPVTTGLWKNLASWKQQRMVLLAPAKNQAAGYSDESCGTSHLLAMHLNAGRQWCSQDLIGVQLSFYCKYASLYWMEEIFHFWPGQSSVIWKLSGCTLGPACLLHWMLSLQRQYFHLFSKRQYSMMKGNQEQSWQMFISSALYLMTRNLLLFLNFDKVPVVA